MECFDALLGESRVEVRASGQAERGVDEERCKFNGEARNGRWVVRGQRSLGAGAVEQLRAQVEEVDR